MSLLYRVEHFLGIEMISQLWKSVCVCVCRCAYASTHVTCGVYFDSLVGVYASVRGCQIVSDFVYEC